MDSPIFEAKKNGPVIELARDPDPKTTRYVVIEGPGALVLFPKDGQTQVSSASQRIGSFHIESKAIDRDSHLRRAFGTLAGRVSSSQWVTSRNPYSDLVACLRSLAAQARLAQDVGAYLADNPSVANSMEMLFTSISMSARADWRAAPARIRGVVARGWFLGRWIPTFLVLDGPILRFLKSTAFQHQTPPSPLLRAVRRFFDTRDFMLLRHAFAHWSFQWEVSGNDSIIVGTDGSSSETVRATRAEADAFHIVTFAMIEAMDEVFLRPHRDTLSAASARRKRRVHRRVS